MYFILFCIVIVIVVFFFYIRSTQCTGQVWVYSRPDLMRCSTVCDCKPVYFKASILVLIIWIKEEREVIRKG